MTSSWNKPSFCYYQFRGCCCYCCIQMKASAWNTNAISLEVIALLGAPRTRYNFVVALMKIRSNIHFLYVYNHVPSHPWMIHMYDIKNLSHVDSWMVLKDWSKVNYVIYFVWWRTFNMEINETHNAIWLYVMNNNELLITSTSNVNGDGYPNIRWTCTLKQNTKW